MPTSVSAQSQTGEGARIVNVDPDNPARLAKARVLKQAGFAVYEASTGKEAIELVLQHVPDLVLLDLHLPDSNAAEVCRQLKSAPAKAAVIALQKSTLAAVTPQASTALNNGADSYLTEPVDPDVLIATVKALLRLRAADHALSAANAALNVVNRDLERSNEDLQQFASVASHDLQEPLRTVTSFVGLLERSARAKLSANEAQYLEFIIEGAQRMRTLIDDLLLYSQVGRALRGTETVNLRIVLDWALDNLGEQIAASGVDIQSGQLPMVEGDAMQLGHVLQNLLSNAIKYRAPGRRAVIRLSAQPRGAKEWLICVQDNGIGVESQYWQTIFAPFKRLHGKDVPGTGIGLALCRRIVEAHAGAIWIESVPGEGSTFFFTLPAASVQVLVA
jgi:two-component system, sensor histidine kinase and response regulator